MAARASGLGPATTSSGADAQEAPAPGANGFSSVTPGTQSPTRSSQAPRNSMLSGRNSRKRGSSASRPSDRLTRKPPEGTENDHELWKAAKKANKDSVKRLLGERADPLFAMPKMPPESEYCVNYKTRPLENCQAIHVAAFYQCEKESKSDSKQSPTKRKENRQEGCERAKEVVEVLLNEARKAKNPDEEAKTWVTSEACCRTEIDGKLIVRKLQPIHLAASTSNTGVMTLLLKNRADVNAPARINNPIPVTEEGGEPGEDQFHVHYMPIHDAVWFKHEDTVTFLLDRHADVDAKNKDCDTPLHLAARLGYAQIAELLLGHPGKEGTAEDRGTPERADDQKRKKFKKSLLAMKNKDKKVPLEVAVESGLFDLSKLDIFTRDLDDDASLLDAFVKVARACPAAASALLRCRNSADLAEDEEAGGVDAQDQKKCTRVWRRCMQAAARQGANKSQSFHSTQSLRDNGSSNHFGANFLANLVRDAPDAAVDVLDLLTITPDETSHEHHPLPIRAHLPIGYDFCQLSCTYESDDSWEWDPNIEKGKEWHKKLAPLNTKKNGEVLVQLVKMPGLATPAFLNSLAHSRNHRMFTRVPVHALLKFVWMNFHCLFVVDLVYEAVAMVVLSHWIVQPDWFESHMVSDLQSRLAWCCVAAQGLIESSHLIGTGARYIMHFWNQDRGPPPPEHGQDKVKTRWGQLTALLERQRGMPVVQVTLEWLGRSWHRWLLAALTVALAVASQEEHWPDNSAIEKAILGTTSFLHWANVLYELRAFQWTGQKLLPIMKSFPQIGGMLVIIIFLLVGFMHAFWAIERSAEESWRLVTFLLMGDNFIKEGYSPMADLNTIEQYTLALVGGLGTFTFSIIAMNLFVAVLGDIYEQQQGLSMCTFLEERARICSSLYMRPMLKRVPRLLPIEMLGGFILAAVSFTTVLWCCAQLEMNSWPAAVVLASWALVHQLSLMRKRTDQWDQKYLWFCTSKDAAEELLALWPDEQEKVMMQGRVSKLKNCINNTEKRLLKEIQELKKGEESKKSQQQASSAASKREQKTVSPETDALQDPSMVAKKQSDSERVTDDMYKLIQKQSEALERLEKKLVELSACSTVSEKTPDLSPRSPGGPTHHCALPVEGGTMAPSSAKGGASGGTGGFMSLPWLGCG